MAGAQSLGEEDGEVLSVAGGCHNSDFLDLDDHPPPLSFTPLGIVGPEQLDVEFFGMPDPSTEIKIKACR